MASKHSKKMTIEEARRLKELTLVGEPLEEDFLRVDKALKSKPAAEAESPLTEEQTVLHICTLLRAISLGPTTAKRVLHAVAAIAGYRCTLERID